MASSSPASSSNAIPIPPRNNRYLANRGSVGSSSSSSSSYSFGTPASSSVSGGFGSLRDASNASNGSARRQSLMSPTFSRAEHTVVNVGEEESPRLITCVKASQGFDWNLEIFLPSYADYHFDDLERRQDPVEDIIVTEEEVEKMFPS